MIEYLALIPIALLSYFLIGKAYWLAREWVFKPLEQEIQNQIPAIPEKVNFFGGPLDGYVDLVPEHVPFYVAPYKAKDGEGEVMSIMGMEVQVPNLAYYRQVEADNYFYVRDISQDEYKTLAATGIEPLADSDTTE